MENIVGDQDVLFHCERGLGWVTLNRPQALNALDHGMVRRMHRQLLAWADDPNVEAVIVTGAGERALCAGGDIRAMYHDARTGGSASLDFWRDEYHLNAYIARYPKPYVAIMKGIVMGGGVGISAHGSVRIVTDNTVIAMPEVGIGFAPDVGGTWLLSRAPGEIGTHLALTASRLKAGDAIACGFADHYVSLEKLSVLLAAVDASNAETLLSSLRESPADSSLLPSREWIDRCYDSDDVEQILVRLRAHPNPDAKKAAESIGLCSPTSLKVTLRSVRSARQLDSLASALNQEYRVSSAMLRSADLVEGIRALLIDKDNAPTWAPPQLEAVDDSAVAGFFADLGAAELGLSSEPGGRAR